MSIKIESHSDIKNKHAVVIGGSMGGLLAARVLADFFEHVTIIERDHYPENPTQRAGVPQGYHVTALMPRGYEIVKKLFPGITEEFRAQGFLETPTEPTMLHITSRGRSMDGPIGMEFFTSDRPVIDWSVHRHLVKRPEIEIREGWEVTDLITVPHPDLTDRLQVTGVQMRQHGTEQKTASLDADFVVDASGRNTPMLKWLKKLGIEEPPIETVASNIGYTSRYYRKPAGYTEPWRVIDHRTELSINPYGVAVVSITPDTWLVTIFGTSGLYPPTDEAGFQQWLEKADVPDILHALDGAEPISPIRGFRDPVNRLFHYDQMSGLPKGLIVLGDALCHLNPVYGQGLSASAIAAEVLQTCLSAENRQDLEERYHQRALQEIRSAWWLSVLDDLRQPIVNHTGLQQMGDIQMAHRYLDHFAAARVKNQELEGAFQMVVALILPVQTIFAPEIVAQVMQDAFPFLGKESL